MALPSSGQIAANQINTELGRSSTAQISITDAKNGSYAAINNASGKRPTSGPYYGFAYTDWYSYNHSAAYPSIIPYLEENSADVNIRFYAYNNYGTNYINEYWYYSNTPKSANLAADTGTTIRENDQIDVLWAWFGWGSYYQYTYKYVYSASRGYLYNGSGNAGDTVSTTFYPQSGEYIDVAGFNY